MKDKSTLLVLCAAIGIASVAALLWLSDEHTAPSAPTESAAPQTSEPLSADLSTSEVTPTRSSARDNGNGHGVLAGQEVRVQRLVIVVQVRDEEGRTPAAAKVQLAAKNESLVVLDATTTHDGVCQFEVADIDSRIAYVTVKAAGYATYLGSKEMALAQWKPAARTQLIQIVLRRACLLDVSVVDDAGRVQPSHMVAFRYLGSGVEPSGQSTLPDGVQPSQLRSTGATGHAMADDLEKGWWLVICDRWKNKAEASHEPVFVDSTRTVPVTIAVPSIPEDQYASGFLKLPNPMPALSEHGTIDEYAIDMEGHGTIAPWLYEGGSFFVYGEPGSKMDVHLASRRDGRKSDVFSLTIGQHLYKIEPRWLN
jgi:hypothetical protein